METEDQTRGRLLRDMVNHGARQVDMGQLARESQIIQHIGPDDEVSETCIRLEEFLSSATRNVKHTLEVIERLQETGDLEDHDLLTALKKYVEDACEGIKVVDNTLKQNDSGLESLLFEIPDQTPVEDVAWRNLIARREVIAHRLLSIDNHRVYREAVRDFYSLHQLLSKVYFVPTKTVLDSGIGFSPLIRAGALRNLAPSANGQTPKIGESLILICEDKIEGFLAFRLGRTEENKILIGSSKAPLNIRLSIHTVNLPDDLTKK